MANVVFGGCLVCLYDLFKMSVRESPQNSTVNCRLQTLSLHQLGMVVSGRGGGGGGWGLKTAVYDGRSSAVPPPKLLRR